jgi:hypothetical protein
METCQLKIEWITGFFLKMAQLLPESPLEFRIQYLTEMINQESSWGLGGVILELLSGIIQYVQLVVAWKFLKIVINILGTKL